MTCKELLGKNLRSAHDVSSPLQLDQAQEDKLSKILERYPMSITPYYYSLIDWNDPDDPIRKMCIPSVDEFDLSGSIDTSGEASNTVITGMQHKYRATALILSTNTCAMYCRHCFRKRLVGLSDEEIATHLDEMFDYLRAHKEINNVLISGGDAFLNDNDVLAQYLDAICGMDHIDFIRFGTRVPVTLPERITGDPALITLLRQYSEKKQLYVMTHFNHPHEITSASSNAVQLLREAGITVRNQTVLLKGVNSSAQTLSDLLRGLTKIGVAPYYIFQCRPVTGVKNQFQIPLHEGYEIVQKAKDLLNGPGKAFRFVMSHDTGKIEILGPLPDGRMLFKYHQAKFDADAGRMFAANLAGGACWLPDGPQARA